MAPKSDHFGAKEIPAFVQPHLTLSPALLTVKATSHRSVSAAIFRGSIRTLQLPREEELVKTKVRYCKEMLGGLASLFLGPSLNLISYGYTRSCA